jgi:hypothetical protein
MQHLDEGTIHSWLDGALSADEAARVEAHVKECPQCAAAVAEARGFVAGASRILTALDNAPRGVIPVAAPKKRFDPLVWRVAATVLVVASASLLLFRDGGREAPSARANADTVSSSTAAGSVAGVAPVAPARDEAIRPTAEIAPTAAKPSGPAGEFKSSITKQDNASAGNHRPNVGVAERSVAGEVTADTIAKKLAAVNPGVADAGITSPQVSQPTVTARENRPTADQKGRVAGIAPSSPGYAGAAAAAPPAVTSQGAPSRLLLREPMSPNAMRGQLPLKVVGTPRTFGAKVTLYEVAPGDTVTLREELDVRLEGVVVAGAAPQARQAVEKSAAAERVKRADTTGVNTADSQRSAGAMRSMIQAPSIPAPISRVEVADGVTTISWVDATGKTLRLSGRMPERRLQQIKIRLEVERAAAAAAAKQNP